MDSLTQVDGKQNEMKSMRCSTYKEVSSILIGTTEIN